MVMRVYLMRVCLLVLCAGMYGNVHVFGDVCILIHVHVCLLVLCAGMYGNVRVYGDFCILIHVHVCLLVFMRTDIRTRTRTRSPFFLAIDTT